MSCSLLFNKPFQVLSQFTPQDDKRTLADYIDVRGVYAAGRLDYDSEGLMLLTDDGALQARIANPRYRLVKTYLAQVEGIADDHALNMLAAGVALKDGPTRPMSPPGCGRVVRRYASAATSRRNGCGWKFRKVVTARCGA
jgi:23S rRNA pseudouridine2457 synthase